MKGIIYNLLQDCLEREYGEEAWDSLIETSGVDGAYTSLGSYPDADLVALVAAAASRLRQDEGEVLRWFGGKAMPLLAERYPMLFQPHRSARTFVLSVNDIIHPEVRKLYPGAVCPHFRFVEESADRLVLGYSSPRQLCQLAQGFIEGALGHFGEQGRVSHVLCMQRGDDTCRLSVEWER